MTRLVILGCGYLGYNLYQLLKEYYPVELWGIESPYTPLLDTYQKVDAFDERQLALLDFKDKVFIDAIGLVANNAKSNDEQRAISDLRKKYLPFLTALKEHGAKRLLFFSSGGTVYGSHKEPIKEDSPLQPLSLYAQSKVAIEEEIQSVGLNHAILRLSNPFGGYQEPNKKQGVIPILIRKAFLQEPFEMWIDGQSVRDYFYITDLANALHCLIENEVNNAIVNIGSGTGTSLQQIIHLISQSTQRTITVIPKETFTTGIQSIVLDITKLKGYGYASKVSLEEGIALETKRIKGELGL